MKIIKMTLGAFETNTYIVADKGNAVVIDPAANAGKIKEVLEQNELTITKILLTHGHYDHTGACAELGAPIFVHWKDETMLYDPDKSFARLIREHYKPCESTHFLNDGDIVEIGEKELSVMHTPGHSAGSVMFIGEGVIFSGDTIFEGSVGRTDGWSGSFAEQKDSLAKINAMSGDYRILPRHGEETTLAREKKHNPYLTRLQA